MIMVGIAHVLADHRHQGLVDDSSVAELQQRDAQAFLEDLGGVGGHRSWRQAAHVLVMRHRRGEGQHLALDDHRLDDCDVRQMRSNT